jgi:hypothetical protein
MKDINLIKILKGCNNILKLIKKKVNYKAIKI